jgi:DNA repair ATPase RecN
LPPSAGDVAPCAVLYDEIDAHVGGRTAVAVGKLLAKQGQSCQVSGSVMIDLYTIMT